MCDLNGIDFIDEADRVICFALLLVEEMTGGVNGAEYAKSNGKMMENMLRTFLAPGVSEGYTISTGTIGEHIPLRTAACGKKKEAKLMLEAEVDASMHRITLACWDLANGLTCKGIVRMVSECCLSM
uniref:Uncharacterized protein n=1 Tax=Oryza meridionalis TaxID=40149 RepID=A0A0E0CZL1_9ORYZ